MKESVIVAKNDIACMYQEKKRECKKKGKKIPDGWLEETINNIHSIRGLPPNVRIPMSTIRNRSKSIVMQESGSETLMAPIEQCLSLANDLIFETQIEKDVIRWKKNRNEYDPEGPVLGKKYW